ncbi:MAG: zinc dependent phospholipase C family protein [Sporomusaceae bacterium]|nr:zinc dependent phospholipase C family protein [Sporomusaceae bacterium]
MQLQEIAEASMVGGVKLLLATAAPLQTLFDKPCVTHVFCNRQAITILSADGFYDSAAFYLRYLEALNAGVAWADQGWKNVNHYFSPDSRQGLWYFSTAVAEFNRYFNHSIRCMRRADPAGACFLLGAAAHLLQDLCVPHHARGKVFCGHKQYEDWAGRHYSRFAAGSGGIYRPGRAESLLLANAAVSADLFSQVASEHDEASYQAATAILLPLAQRTTAGLLLRFYQQMCQRMPSHAVFVA